MPLVLAGRKDLPPKYALSELLAFMKKERLKAALPGFMAPPGHLATTLLAAGSRGHGRPDSLSRRRAGHDRPVGRGMLDLFFATAASRSCRR